MPLGQNLEPFEYASPELKEHDVRVSVTHCGVCHTDIHAIDDYYGITTFPFVPGHEIVGHVAAVGPAVTGLKEGDRVGIGWQGRSCGKCEWCLKGETQLCMEIEEYDSDGSLRGFLVFCRCGSSICVPAPPSYALPGCRGAHVCRCHCLFGTPDIRDKPRTEGRHRRSGRAGSPGHPIRPCFRLRGHGDLLLAGKEGAGSWVRFMKFSRYETRIVSPNRPNAYPMKIISQP